jgi:hypothetical protein
VQRGDADFDGEDCTVAAVGEGRGARLEVDGLDVVEVPGQRATAGPDVHDGAPNPLLGRGVRRVPAAGRGERLLRRAQRRDRRPGEAGTAVALEAVAAGLERVEVIVAGTEG